MNIVVAIIIILISTFLFKKASGTLKVNLINISSFAFYSLMAFEFIGVTLVFLGYRDHYLISKITDNNVINKTYWSMAYVMIILPLTIFVSNYFIFKLKKIDKTYIKKIQQDIIMENTKTQKMIYIIVVMALFICLIAIIYVFCCIGYVPLFKYFDSNFNFAEERINTVRNFNGNEYIKNIVMLMVTPILSYIAYIYMRTTKEKKWLILFIISFILNVFVKTYDFSKAPLIYYICYFFIIEVTLGKTFKLKKIIPFVIVAIVLVVLSYTIVAGYRGSFISLSNGPISRVVISQAGTLFLHFDAFPEKIDYLNGHSFPPIFKFIFGEGDYYVRSGRVVMQEYNKAGIENGTAGVMSTVFLGEAYANFGIFGIIISPILVGLIFSSILCIFLKSKKTPLNIVLYLQCFIIFTNVLLAGFIDFIYNIQFMVSLLVVFGIKIVTNEKNINFVKENVLLKMIKRKNNEGE